ncbi:MAG TPA: ATP-binding protein [Chthoniobacterales bacterium]|nr:ATP-binding protein [Chthoniobacterales bacterium]
MSTGSLAVWLASLGAAITVALIFWRRMVVLRAEVRRLLTDGTLSSEIRGPRILREIHRDLGELASRNREISRRIADEDYSLRAILSGMIEGVLIADRNLRIRLTNDRLRQMFMLPKSPVDRTVMEVFRNHLLHQIIQQTLETDEPRSVELQSEIREGNQFNLKHFQVTSISLRPRDRESLTGALVIFHDISQIRSLEAIRREFVANVSHELRTPLSIITGYLETLIEGGGDPETNVRFLKTMHKHAQRLNILIEDLLSLSQLESRRVSLNFEAVELRECVHRVIERLDTRIREVAAKVRVNIPESLPRVEADAFRIEQVIYNLIDNALKHGGKSGVNVMVDAHSNGREAIVAVHDDGPGVPLGDQPHLFERFYRVHKDRSRDAGGSGLGLSIVKHTVQAHGGTVALQSSPGAGATFTVSLPLKQV